MDEKSESKDSENARRHFYLLVKLGLWLANLPIRVNTIATLVVMYVRWTEGYGIKVITWVQLIWNALIAAVGLIFHLIRSPQWVWEGAFKSNPRRRGIRPLFGWIGYSSALLTLSL